MTIIITIVATIYTLCVLYAAHVLWRDKPWRYSRKSFLWNVQAVLSNLIAAPVLVYMHMKGK